MQKRGAASCPSPASSQPNPCFYEHPPPAPGPDCHREACALVFLHHCSLCCLLLFSSVQGEQQAHSKGKKRFHSHRLEGTPLLSPSMSFRPPPMELLTLDKQQWFTGVWDWARKAVYLSWDWKVFPGSPYIIPAPCLGLGGFCVRALTRSSKLPHEHKHQRTGMCVF